MKAVLFDLDGTLVDSARDIQEALNEAMAVSGASPFSLDEVKRMIGGGVRSLIDRALARRGLALGPAEREALAERYWHLYEPRATRLVELMPGAEEVIRRVRAAGLATGVVTNKPVEASRQILAHYGLLESIDVVIGGDAGPPVKPAPDLLLLAAQRLGIAAPEILFVGDSENDAGAARAAGMRLAILRGGYTALEPEALEADDLLGDLFELQRLLPGASAG